MQGRRNKERGEERKNGEKKERKGGVTLATPVSAPADVNDSLPQTLVL